MKKVDKKPYNEGQPRYYYDLDRHLENIIEVKIEVMKKRVAIPF